MNFFQAQQRHHLASLKLLLLFFISFALYFQFLLFCFWLMQGIFTANASFSPAMYFQWLHADAARKPALVLLVFFITSFLYFKWQMRHSGAQIAHWLGAVPINRRQQDERVVQQVVDEIAIAVGCLPPEVFVLRFERAMNAFVVGGKQSHVIVLTQGMIKQMDREQLQGVIAHEFAHIHHGDCAQQQKLIAVIGCIVFIKAIGLQIMRIGTPNEMLYGKSTGWLWLPGAVVWAIGAVGSLCAKLIFAGISRQRESLADAAAVQFTRFPEGLASALYVISEYQEQGRLKNSKRELINHLCIAPAIQGGVQFAWFATHPAINARIKAIAPHFSMRKRYQKRNEKLTVSETASQQHYLDKNCLLSISDLQDPAVLMALVQNPLHHHLALSRALQKEIPSGILQQIKEPSRARQVIEALFIRLSHTDAEALFRWYQSEYRLSNEQLKHYLVFSKKLPLKLWLVVLELAIPALRQHAEQSNKVWLERLQTIVDWDDALEVRELVMLAILRKELVFEPLVAMNSKESDRVLAQLLMVIAHTNRNRSKALACYTMMLKTMGIQSNASTNEVQVTQATIHDLSLNLARCSLLAANKKTQLISAVFTIIKQDQQLSVEEYELLRLVSLLLDQPMPPLLDILQSVKS